MMVYSALMTATHSTRLNGRIKLIREQHKISKSDLARRLEISPAYVSSLESGEKTTISSRLAKVIQHEFGVNREWLLEGKGEPFLPADNPQLVRQGAIGERAEAEIGDLSAFERLLSEVSATYINLPVNDLTKVIRDDFARLSRALGVDGCILYIGGEDPSVFHAVKPFCWFVDEEQEANKAVIEWLNKNPSLDGERFSYGYERFIRGDSIRWERLDDIPVEAEGARQNLLSMGVKSTMAVPIWFAGSARGVINICTTRNERKWPDHLIPRLRLFGEVFINALMRKQAEEKLQKALSEIKLLKERIEADYLYLKEEINTNRDFKGVVGKSDALKRLLIQAKQAAPTNVTVLILGETGTGKGLIARAIHNASSRKDRPLMQVNCAAFSPSLIESELFGHEKGAFTGATTRHIGRFEAAKGTTLFLDEIGDLPLELQPKLLRVLEEGEFERVGGSSTIRTDVRLIAATSSDLEKEIGAGRFRRDLWYRLSIFPIVVPPLRERLDDIPLFVTYFVENSTKWPGKRFNPVPHDIIKALQAYYWPGNIRELKNVIERALIVSPDGNLRIEIPAHQGEPVSQMKTLTENEREHIIKVLEKTNWRIKGPHGAAQYLDIHPETLRTRMRKLGIRRSNLPLQ
jgi:formate hydrogenlyase transcriptional activator